MIVSDLFEKTDAELAAMLRDIGNEPIEWTPVIQSELNRRNVVLLREETTKLHGSSQRLENLSKWLILLTIILAIVALPPAYEVIDRVLGSDVPQHVPTRSRTLSDTSGWLSDGPVPVKGAVTYSSDAMFGSDVPLPEIQEFRASVKLIQPPLSQSLSERVVAYKANIRIGSLQKKDVPAKYLRKVVEQYEGVPVTTLPLEQVTYTAQLNFELLDRDGFVLLEITGPNELLQSGTSNVLQHLTTTSIPWALAKRVVKIRPSIYIVRCESCRVA